MPETPIPSEQSHQETARKALIEKELLKPDEFAKALVVIHKLHTFLGGDGEDAKTRQKAYDKAVADVIKKYDLARLTPEMIKFWLDLGDIAKLGRTDEKKQPLVSKEAEGKIIDNLNKLLGIPAKYTVTLERTQKTGALHPYQSEADRILQEPAETTLLLGITLPPAERDGKPRKAIARYTLPFGPGLLIANDILSTNPGDVPKRLTDLEKNPRAVLSPEVIVAKGKDDEQKKEDTQKATEDQKKLTESGKAKIAAELQGSTVLLIVVRDGVLNAVVSMKPKKGDKIQLPVPMLVSWDGKKLSYADADFDRKRVGFTDPRRSDPPDFRGFYRLDTGTYRFSCYTKKNGDEWK
jgi:hypothetical protein